MEKRRILLVDDEETFTRSLKSYLEKTGRYDVRTESHGAEAAHMVRAFQPHLILLDVVMPDGDGGRIAAQLKADERTERIPVVFLTAVVSREEVSAHAGRIGGQQFLAKPVSAREVLTCIERQLEPA